MRRVPFGLAFAALLAVCAGAARAADDCDTTIERWASANLCEAQIEALEYQRTGKGNRQDINERLDKYGPIINHCPALIQKVKTVVANVARRVASGASWDSIPDSLCSGFHQGKGGVDVIAESREREEAEANRVAQLPTFSRSALDGLNYYNASGVTNDSVKALQEFIESRSEYGQYIDRNLVILSCGGDLDGNARYPYSLTSGLEGDDAVKLQVLRRRWSHCVVAVERLDRAIKRGGSSSKPSAAALHWVANGYATGNRGGYWWGQYAGTLSRCLPDTFRALAPELAAFRALNERISGNRDYNDLYQRGWAWVHQPYRPGNRDSSCPDRLAADAKLNYLGITVRAMLDNMAGYRSASPNYDYVFDLGAAEMLDARLGN